MSQPAIQKVEELNNTVLKKNKSGQLDFSIACSANNFWIGKIQAVLAFSSDEILGSIIIQQSGWTKKKT